MENEDFVVFIITHGRPDKVVTLKTLKNSGYTGNIFLIVDNEDKTIDQYQKNYGYENVKIFDKKAMADKVDEGNNFDNRRTTTHARNACFEIAISLGYKYFLVLDDDYTSFEYRYNSKDGLKLLVKKIDNIDFIFDQYLNYFKSTSFLSIAMAQGGDFIGGVSNPYVIKRPLLRKAMNSFFCSVERPFNFIGQLNEDVNTYVTLGQIGGLFGTIPMISLVQMQTQKTKGGMSDAYLLYGTYVKSFTTVMMSPSNTKVSMINTSNSRIHHSIKWVNTAPMILAQHHKKQ